MLNCAGSEVMALKIRNMVLCALFASLMAVCAWIAVPIGGGAVYTLQTFAVFLALLTLGGMRGTVAIFVYLCLGAVGLPVFSGFRGGFGSFFDLTGGYLWGFLIIGLVYWLLTGLFGAKMRIPAAILGMLFCYLCGLLWFCVSQAGGFRVSSLGPAFLVSVLPYLLPDAVKIALAFLLSHRLKRFV